MASCRHPTELQQREHLALRFGLVLRRDAGELARRERTGRAMAAALAVPYYALLHHGNVVPRQALAQRGRLDGVVAVRLPGPGADAAEVTGCAELIARVLMAEHEARGAVYSIRTERWDATTGEGLLRIDAASALGGPTDVPIADGDLDPLLHALFRTVDPHGRGLAIVRDPIAVREYPATTWRWLVPLREQSSLEEFAELHRRMSFAVLTALVGAPPRDLAPLKSVPDWYVDLP
ncbi:hypothetical protein [Brachybacterium paraconglomeratum]|uniref:hypothetical protein n=1 Tax=Brachybacterium paraconglomeratum TaxID=173362 RepID=UPI00380F278E